MTNPAPPETEWSRLPRSQADAKREGSRCYYTGRRCKRDHLAARWTSTGACTICCRMHGAWTEEQRKHWERWSTEGPE